MSVTNKILLKDAISEEQFYDLNALRAIIPARCPSCGKGPVHAYVEFTGGTDVFKVAWKELEGLMLVEDPDYIGSRTIVTELKCKECGWSSQPNHFIDDLAYALESLIDIPWRQ